jgi:hypothetical protein
MHDYLVLFRSQSLNAMFFLSSKTLANDLEMHMLASYIIVSSSCIITQYLTLDASVERGVIGSSMSTLGNPGRDMARR